MKNETISVTNTESGHTMDAVVLRKSTNRISVVIGKGVHSVQCDLAPTRTGRAYSGTVMGREIVYHRSRDEVQADLDRDNPALKKSRSFRK